MKRKTKKKNILVCCTLIFTLLAVTGCESLNYTSEQEDIIANYAANLVLRHDVNYKYNYITEEETTTIEETTTLASITEEVTTSSSNGTTENQSSDSSDVISNAGDITAALQLPEGINVEYLDYDVVDQYPSDAASTSFVMKALENSKLLIVKFNVTNTTSQDIGINLMSNGKKFKGIVNENKKYNAQLTLLLDALNTFEGTINAGSTQTLVLIYQTQLDSKDDVKKLSISINDDSNNEIDLNLK